MADRVPARLTAAQGRRFAFTVGAAFLVFGGIAWWRQHPTAATVLASLGALLAVPGYLLALVYAPTPAEALVIPLTILAVVMLGALVGSVLAWRAMASPAPPAGFPRA